MSSYRSLVKTVAGPADARCSVSATLQCGCDAALMAHLILPTTSVQASYLQGETETAMEEGSPTSWLAEAAADFTGFVARRCGIRELWGVPVTELWFGGHIGYHVVPRHRGRGHATQMLAQAKPACQALGLTELLITCGEDNIGSRRVIEANGGVLERIVDGEARYCLPTSHHEA